MNHQDPNHPHNNNNNNNPINYLLYNNNLQSLILYCFKSPMLYQSTITISTTTTNNNNNTRISVVTSSSSSSITTSKRRSKLSSSSSSSSSSLVSLVSSLLWKKKKNQQQRHQRYYSCRSSIPVSYNTLLLLLWYYGILLVSIHNVMTTTTSSLSLSLSSSSSFFTIITIPIVDASWIDPLTPMDARTTIALNVKAPPKPSPEEDDSTTTTTMKKKKKHHYTNSSTTTNAPSTVPTFTPTTMTDLPTTSPTTSPTMYPTFDSNKKYELVFSDEFNIPYREFYDGADPRWTALDKNDYTNDALHYYSSQNVYTNSNGELIIKSTAADIDIIGYDDVKLHKTHVKKHFQSAMIQSWNKFCITGGIIEAKVTLPGQSNVGGLWPAFWLLGNLARHTYVGSSEHIWPFATTKCSTNHPKGYVDRKQKISGCNKVAHYGMEPYVGRGAPEIDIFEVQPGNIQHNTGPFLKSSVGQPFMSTSYQVAPGRSANRPGSGEWPGPGQWYNGLLGGFNTSLNILFYGTYNHFRDDVDPAKEDYWSDAISYNRQLDESYFNSSHIYRLEWDVPSPNGSSYGYLHWFLDDELVYSIDGKALSNSDTSSTTSDTNTENVEISSEPSYIILNTAISKQWGFPTQCPNNCPCKVYNCNSKRWQDICGFSMGFCKMMLQHNNDNNDQSQEQESQSPEYKIDYIRVYQDPNDPKQKVGCSTPERPTRKYILAHEHVYKLDSDEHPLKGISIGLGSCDPKAVGITREACGGNDHGRCTDGHVCECYTGWTGPHCLANVAYNDIEYDISDTIYDIGFIPPLIAPMTLWGSMCIMILLLLIGMYYKKRLAIWEPIPDVSEEYIAAAKKYQYLHRRGMSV